MAGNLGLGIDNSLDFLNLVLADDGRLLEERHSRPVRPSSQVLPVRVERLLSDHDLRVNDLSRLFVTLGPGSFTGVRVALSFGKGLASALGIPLVGLPTLDVLASPLAVLTGLSLAPLVDAKKGEVFFSLYRSLEGRLERLTPYLSLKPADVLPFLKTPCVCFGTGVRLCEDLLDREGVIVVREGFQRISGEALVRMGSAATGEEEAGLRPIYGRRSEAEIKFNITID